MSEPVTDLRAVVTPTRIDARRFRLDVAEGWNQGRGAFGGLVLGALERAMEVSEGEGAGGPEGRALRSLTGVIAGPVLAGAAEIEVTALRRGTGVSTWIASLAQGEAPLAHATAVFAKARADGTRYAPPAPKELKEPWRDVPLFAPGPAGGPHFTRHLEFRSVGPRPMAGVPEPVAAGWIRPMGGAWTLGTAETLALVDAWWPTTFATLTEWRPMATIAFTLQYFPPRAPLSSETPLFHRARAVAAQDGYIAEQRELWSAEGELVALNQQTFVAIR